jgi:RNA 2',3'-cyclic 3'-phosphodiesterase
MARLSRAPSAVLEQFSLPGFDPAPTRKRPPNTLFFAILPPASALAGIERAALALREQHGLTGKPIRTDRLHVTLHSLGGFDDTVPQGLVDAASAAASTIAMPCCEVVFDRALSFTGSGAFVLRGDDAAAPISAFRHALGEALAHAGLRAEPINTAHMTLAYDDRRIAEHRLDEPLRMAVEAFVLIHSLVGQGVHRHLGRWSLCA